MVQLNWKEGQSKASWAQMHDYPWGCTRTMAQAPGSVQRNSSLCLNKQWKERHKLPSQGAFLSVDCTGTLQNQLRLVTLVYLKLTFLEFIINKVKLIFSFFFSLLCIRAKISFSFNRICRNFNKSITELIYFSIKKSVAQQWLVLLHSFPPIP